MRPAFALVVFVVACSGANENVPPTTGSGSAPAELCEGTRAKVEQLYRTEAEANEPKRVDAAVADNTQMVMNDCAKDPAKVAACISGISTIAELEAKCLHPLDEEGTEGNDLK
jgi:hypothetical protein